MELGYENNIGQEYNGEAKKEVLVVEVKHLDVEWQRSQVTYDFAMEGEDMFVKGVEVQQM